MGVCIEKVQCLQIVVTLHTVCPFKITVDVTRVLLLPGKTHLTLCLTSCVRTGTEQLIQSPAAAHPSGFYCISFTLYLYKPAAAERHRRHREGSVLRI